MRNDQKKFLKQRLEEANRLRRARVKSPWNRDESDAPAAIRSAYKARAAASKVIDRYEKSVRKAHEDEMSKVASDYRKALEALLFHDPAKALAAVVEFEKRIPQS